MKCTVITIVAVTLLSVLPRAQAAESDAAKGKELFVKYACYQCHGREGQGGAAGARIAPHPIALQAMIAYVRHPAGQMPPVTAKVVSDAELADIYAFLKTIQEPKPVKDIPLLNQTISSPRSTVSQSERATELPDGKGKQVVAAKCAGCHELDTVSAARHTREEWQNVVAAMMEKGATLTPGEIPAVVEYLSAHFGTAGTTARGKPNTTPGSKQ